MTNIQKQEPAGAWIPNHVLLDPEIGAPAKILYGLIASFKICYASNKWLAVRLGVNERAVQKTLEKLEAAGYITRTEQDGQRYIVAIRDEGRPKVRGGDVQMDVGGTSKSSPNNKVEDKAYENPAGAGTPGNPLMGKKEPLADQNIPAPALTKNDTPTVLKLYCDVNRKYGLPVRNFNHIRAKAKAMETEAGTGAIEYLQRLLDVDYATLDGEYKPTINDSLDIYAKRLLITNFLNQAAPLRRQPAVAKTAYEQAVEREAERKKSGGWGF